jgi:hypothetical protein
MVGAEEHVCEWRDDGTIDTAKAQYLRMPMCPHKADQDGEQGDELLFPRSEATGLSGTFEITADFVNDYPVPKRLHDQAAWFRKDQRSSDYGGSLCDGGGADIAQPILVLLQGPVHDRKDPVRGTGQTLLPRGRPERAAGGERFSVRDHGARTMA